jgi:hypothetical protein
MYAGRADDDAGPESGRALAPKEAPEQRIVERRLAHFLCGEKRSPPKALRA